MCVNADHDPCMQNIQGMTGTPMVAASPERHDGGIQANPVEVQSYQPPWKVLSDFALQSDIDQPAFQQLVRRFLFTNRTISERFKI